MSFHASPLGTNNEDILETMPHATLPTPRIYKTSEAITLKARQRARDLVLKAKAGDTLAQAKWSAQKQDYADRYVKKFGDDEEAKAKYFASRKLREQKKERMRQVLSQAQATVDENTGTAKMEPSDEVESEQEDGMKREVRDDEGV